jgi:hypothetical protein
MISTEKIAQLIEHPEQISQEYLEDLQKLCEDYPFSPVFPQLLLKGLSLNDPISFEKKLKLYAYRVPDRSQLFSLIHQAELSSQENSADSLIRTDHNKEEQSKNEESIEVDQIKANEVIHSEDTASSDDHASHINADDVSQKVVDMDASSIRENQKETGLNRPDYREQNTQDTNLEDENVASSIILLEHHSQDTTEKNEFQIEGKLDEDLHRSDDTEPNSKETSTIKEEDSIGDLERDILAHAVSSSIFLEIDEDEEEVENQDFFVDIDWDIERTSIEQDEHDEIETYREADVAIGSQERDYTEKTASKHSFIGWLSRSDDNPSKIPTGINKEDKVVNEVFEKLSESKKSTIETVQKSFFSPIQKAKESLDESRLPVSETLAKVYTLQGNYPKAIEAYEQLLLNFPEKKSFFALQMESLKRKLK